MQLTRAQILALWHIAINRAVAETKFELTTPNNYGELLVVATLDDRPWATWKLSANGGYEAVEEHKDENKEVQETEI